MNASATPPVQNVAIIGAGTIGASWAALFLAHNLKVVLSDPDDNAQTSVRTYIQQVWPTLQTLHGASASIPWHLLTMEPNLDLAVANADFIQENAPEREDFKIDLFARIDAAAPQHAIIASSSSGLLISRMQSRCKHPQRCVIGHPFNPPHLIPLVEVVGGKDSGATEIERAMAFYRQVGKYPIKVNKEVTGHIANRLQAAVWREAIYLAMEGVASIEDIDAAMSQGPGIRWAVFGPHMTFHLGGGQGGMAHFLDHLQGPVQTWWDDLGDAKLDDATRQKLIDGLAQESHGRSIDDLAQQRDAVITRILAAKIENNGQK